VIPPDKEFVMRSIAAAGLSIGLLLLAARTAAQTAEKPNFTGTWTLDPAKSELSSTKGDTLTWDVEQKGTSLKLAETSADRKDSKFEYSCATTGKECEVATGKDPLKISTYYNGATLVQFYRGGASGDHISKRQWQLSEDKKALTVNVVYITPDAKAEKLVFTKH
jgi:hypothetical protein